LLKERLSLIGRYAEPFPAMKLVHRSSREFMGKPGETFKIDRVTPFSGPNVKKGLEQFGQVTYEIEAPDGTPMFKPAAVNRMFEDEDEYVLPVGTKIFVMSRSELKGGKVLVRGRIVP
jgi:hypothetical protein